MPRSRSNPMKRYKSKKTVQLTERNLAKGRISRVRTTLHNILNKKDIRLTPKEKVWISNVVNNLDDITNLWSNHHLMKKRI